MLFIRHAAPVSSAPPRAAAVTALLQPPGRVRVGHPSGHGGTASSPPPRRRHAATATAAPGEGLLQRSEKNGWLTGRVCGKENTERIP